MKYFAQTFLALSLTLTFGFAFALDLDTARAGNLVQELPNGYLRASDPKAKPLVDDVNAKRKAAYEKVAKETNVPVDQVATQAAQKIQSKMKSK